MTQSFYLNLKAKKHPPQKVAEQNAENILMRQHPPKTGRTSFPILEQEMSMKGIDPTQLDIWMESRTRGKGIEDEDIEDLLEQFTRELSKKPESERTREYKDQIFKNALGNERHGRVRCKGRGVTPSNMRALDVATSAQRKLFEQEKNDLQKLKDEVSNEYDKILQVKEDFLRDKEDL